MLSGFIFLDPTASKSNRILPKIGCQSDLTLSSSSSKENPSAVTTCSLFVRINHGNDLMPHARWVFSSSPRTVPIHGQSLLSGHNMRIISRVDLLIYLKMALPVRLHIGGNHSSALLTIVTHCFDDHKLDISVNVSLANIHDRREIIALKGVGASKASTMRILRPRQLQDWVRRC